VAAAVSEYHIRVQLVSGGEEEAYLGRAGLHEFSLMIDAGSEEEALGEKGYKAIEEWCDKHRLLQSRYIFNLADRFKGARPFTIENFEAEYPEPSMEGATRCPLTGDPTEVPVHPLQRAVAEFMADRGIGGTGEPVWCGMWRWEQAPAKFETSKCPGCGYWIMADWREGSAFTQSSEAQRRDER
jgi:hypothetical protein